MARKRERLEEKREFQGREADAVNKGAEQRLSEVVGSMVPDEEAKSRMIEGIRKRKRSARRFSWRISAAVLTACLFVCLLWLGVGQSLTGEELVVYAATEEQGWQRLEEGERILLKKETFDVCGEYPYLCTFRLEVPENYLYDRQMAIIGVDHVGIRPGEKDVIEWWVAKERPEDEGRVMQGVFRLWLVNDQRERVGAYELELTKKNGNCYAKLHRVWTKRGK